MYLRFYDEKWNVNGPFFHIGNKGPCFSVVNVLAPVIVCLITGKYIMIISFPKYLCIHWNLSNILLFFTRCILLLMVMLPSKGFAERIITISANGATGSPVTDLTIKTPGAITFYAQYQR